MVELLLSRWRLNRLVVVHNIDALDQCRAQLLSWWIALLWSQKDVAKVVKKLSSGKILRDSLVHVAEKVLLLPAAKLGGGSEILK